MSLGHTRNLRRWLRGPKITPEESAFILASIGRSAPLAKAVAVDRVAMSPLYYFLHMKHGKSRLIRILDPA